MMPMDHYRKAEELLVTIHASIEAAGTRDLTGTLQFADTLAKVAQVHATLATANVTYR